MSVQDPLEAWLAGGDGEEQAEQAPQVYREFVVVRRGDRFLGFGLAHVRRVVRDVRVSLLPAAHPTLPGVASVDGRVVPVLDIGPLLGEEALPVDGTYWGVWVAEEDLEALVLAQDVVGLQEVPEDRVSPEEDTPLLAGHYPWPVDRPEHTVHVVNVPALLERALQVYE